MGGAKLSSHGSQEAERDRKADKTSVLRRHPPVTCFLYGSLNSLRANPFGILSSPELPLLNTAVLSIKALVQESWDIACLGHDRQIPAVVTVEANMNVQGKPTQPPLPANLPGQSRAGDRCNARPRPVQVLFLRCPSAFDEFGFLRFHPVSWLSVCWLMNYVVWAIPIFKTWTPLSGIP